MTDETVPLVETVSAHTQPMRIETWRAVVEDSTALYELGEVQAYDATGVGRIGTSRQYLKPTNYTVQVPKRPLLVWCDTSSTPYILVHEPPAGFAGRLVTPDQKIGQLATLILDSGYE